MIKGLSFSEEDILRRRNIIDTETEDLGVVEAFGILWNTEKEVIMIMGKDEKGKEVVIMAEIELNIKREEIKTAGDITTHGYWTDWDYIHYPEQSICELKIRLV